MKKLRYLILSIALMLIPLNAFADGVGLAEKPYSISEVQKTLVDESKYDTLTYSDWQEEGIFKNLYQNGYYILRVKDKLDNVSYKAILIDGLTEKFEVSFIDKDLDDDTELNEDIKFIKVNETVSGSSLGTDTDLSKYYEGYYYDSCTSTVVSPYDKNIVYRYFKAKICKITYHNAEGKTLSAEEVKYGNGIAYTSEPVKSSITENDETITYEFAGWVDENGKKVDVNKITGDYDLYPSYNEVVIPNSIEIGFHYNDAAGTVKYISGKPGEIEAPYPTKENAEDETGKYWYSFEYWTLSDGTRVFDLGSLTHDTDLYAVYSEVYVPTYEVPEVEENNLELEDPEEIEVKQELEVEEQVLPTLSINPEPTSKVAKDLKATLDDNRKVIDTVAKVSIIAVIMSILSNLLLGGGVIQALVFVYALYAKNRRYIRGVWLLGQEDIHYVDKWGREVKVTFNEKTRTYEYKNKKGKDLYGVDVTKEFRKLESMRIDYKTMNKEISESEVYTVFSKDVKIECGNVKSSDRTFGFSLTRGFKDIGSSLRDYSVKITSGSKEFMFDIKNVEGVL